MSLALGAFAFAARVHSCGIVYGIVSHATAPPPREELSGSFYTQISLREQNARDGDDRRQRREGLEQRPRPGRGSFI